MQGGVLGPNNGVKSAILAFTPSLTTSGGCHSNYRHVNHPESCIIWKMRIFDKMAGSKIKCLGVPEPNNEMRFGFYPQFGYWWRVLQKI